MAITSHAIVNEHYSDTDEGVRSYHRIVEVFSDTRLETPRAVVLYLLGQFPPYSPYPGDSWCRARRPSRVQRREQDKTAMIWRATIEYTNRPLRIDQQNELGNPLDKPIVVSGSFVRAMKAATEDRNEDPILNSAGEPYAPAPEIDDSRDSLIVERNTATIDLAYRAALRDKVNSNAQWGLEPRTIKLCQWLYTIEYYAANFYYIANRWEFEIDVKKWNFRRLDMGRRELIDGEFVPIMANDEHIREPVLLDGAGERLVAPADPVMLESEIYDEAAFSGLPLPDPLF